MKKTISEVSIIVLILALLISAFTVPLSAATDYSQVIDVTWQYPTAIKAVEQRTKEFVISTATDKGRINNFYISFPKDGGIRIRMDEKGYFDSSEYSDISFSEDGSSIIMTAGGSTAYFYYDEEPWKLEIRDADNYKVLEYTAEDFMLGYNEDSELKKVKICADISKDEFFFGLGERFNGFIQNGKTVEMWNYDSVSQLKTAYGDHNVGYKNIPILHSNLGYSVFFNSTYYAIADIGNTDDSQYSFEFHGPILDFYIWTDTAEKNISHYFSLTGNTLIIPKWALSYWAGQTGTVWRQQSRSESITLENITETFERYKSMGINIKNVYAEGCWYFDSVMKYFKDNGMHVFGWTDSTWRTYDNITDTTPANEVGSFKKMDASLYPLVTKNTNPLRFYRQNDSAMWVDYTDPLSVIWLKERLLEPFTNGLQGMMVDYADSLDVNSRFSNGATGETMHNMYPLYYNKAMYETFSDYWGEDYITFARAGCAGSQKYTAVFAGDQSSSFLGLKQVVSALLSSSASGINLWGSDIGGYGTSTDKNKNDPEVYARWLAFGTFSPIMRTHGSSSRDPWAYDENGASEKLFLFYYWTREALIDYINSAQIKASLENTAITQPMVVAYPDDAGVAKNETQYMFGGDIMVCPVVESGVSSLEVNFPKGRWVNLWDGSVYNNATFTAEAGVDKIPVYVREGAVIPVTLSSSLGLGEKNTENGVKALIITPSDTERKVKYYEDKENFREFTSSLENSGKYILSSNDICNEKTILVYGVTADSVIVDGEALSSLPEKPDGNSSEKGFYVDYELNRTIIITGKEWQNIKYSDSEKRITNLALNCAVTFEDGGSFAETAQMINDGKYETCAKIGNSEKFSFTLNLEKSYNLSEILVKWDIPYASNYNISVSEDGESWQRLNSFSASTGGSDRISADNISCRYIKFSDFKSAQKKSPQITEIEVHGDSIYIESEGQPNRNKEAQTDVLNTSGLNIIIGIASGIIVIITGLVICFIILKKKKNSRGKSNEVR